MTFGRARLRAAMSRLIAARRRPMGPTPAQPVAPLPRPLHADWVLRPGPWARAAGPGTWPAAAPGTRLSPEVALFHDCPDDAVDVVQERGAEPPHALLLRPGAFRGQFLSLAIDLPAAALEGLGTSHILALAARCGTLPAGSVARLNLRQHARAFQVTRGLSQGLPFEFDLAALPLAAQPVTAGWIDLILGVPLVAPVRIADLTLSRRPRAEP